VPAAIVTGADSGIGRATAVVLSERGWDLGITYFSDEEGAHETAAEVEGNGGRAEVRQVDLGGPARGARVVGELADALGGLDALVNNAAAGTVTPFLELDLEEWRHVLSVNLDASFACAQEAAKRMVAAGRGGRIVNVTSIHEHIPLKGAAAYCAAKGGLGMLTRCMALELAEHGILVNSIAPGQIATPMTGAHNEDPGTIDRPAIPLRRPGHAREVAYLIAHICSQEASYTTGASLIIDGGLTLTAAVANQEV